MVIGWGSIERGNSRWVRFLKQVNTVGEKLKYICINQTKAEKHTLGETRGERGGLSRGMSSIM